MEYIKHNYEWQVTTKGLGVTHKSQKCGHFSRHPPLPNPESQVVPLSPEMISHYLFYYTTIMVILNFGIGCYLIVPTSVLS